MRTHRIKTADEMTDTHSRVKVYVLNSNRQWEDKGTGHVSTPYIKQLKGISLRVLSETDGSQLLLVRIQPNVAYQKQQETLIVWSEDKDFDLALSFQERAGCEEVWKIICQLQGKDSSVDITQDIIEESEDEDGKLGEIVLHSLPQIDLPVCEFSNLKEINELICSNMYTPVRKERLATIIGNENYIDKLLNLFRMCEDLEDNEGLHYLYEIFSNIFLLNKQELYEQMIQESNILDVVGCLEYVPTSPTPRCYRQHLKEQAKYKEVIPITKPELLKKIHQTYKIQYIQDIVLPIPPITENNMFSVLSNILLMNKVEIVTSIQDDEDFLRELFKLLNDGTTDDLKRKDLILLLKELFVFAQSLQPPERESFCKKLSSFGIFLTFEMNLSIDDTRARAALIDILTCFVEFSPSTVRDFIAGHSESKEHKAFMLIVIDQITNDSDPEMSTASQLFCMLKTLVDPENMLLSGNQSEKMDFLNYFYKTFANLIIAPLLDNTKINPLPKADYRVQQLLAQIIDFCCYCVDHHTYHIKNYILETDLLKRTMVLMKSEHIFVALGALKFMRKIIGQLDDIYNNYVMKDNHFAPIVGALMSIRKNNILSSAIMEMFHFINIEGNIKLCVHIVDNFWNILSELDHISIFKSLKMRCDSYREKLKDQDNTSESSPLVCKSRYRRDDRDLEEGEEKWFNEDDVDENELTNEESKNVSQDEPTDNENPLPDINEKTVEINVSKQVVIRNKQTISFDTISPNSCKLVSGISDRVLSLKRTLVDYEGDSDDEDDTSSPPPKCNKLS